MKILFAGDLFLGGSPRNVKTNIDKLFLNKISSCDFYVFNLECVHENPLFQKRKDKGSILTFLEEDLVNFLKYFPAEKVIFSLANNHINDLGDEGLIETKKILDKYNISYFGAGLKAEAGKPFLVNGEIAILAFSTNNFNTNSLLATDKIVGVNEANIITIRNNTDNLKKNGIKYVVIILHMGREYVEFPSIEERELSKKSVESGADLIIFHHPHVIRGKEIYQDKNIYYSLGNFIFPNFLLKNGSYHKWKSNNNYSIIVLSNFNGIEISHEEIGCYFNQYKRFLNESKMAIKILLRNSQPMSSLTDQMYYSFHEKEYVTTVNSLYRRQRKISHRIVRRIMRFYFEIFKN